MRNRPIFKKVKGFVDAQGWTIEQIQDVTAAQMESLLNLTEEEFREYRKYAPGIKVILVRDLQEKANDQTVVNIKSQVHTWLLVRFPGYEVEKDFHDKKHRKVIIHLDGRDG